MNRYIYVGNNPVNRVDPSGYGWLKNKWNSAKSRVKSTYNSVRKTVTKTVRRATSYVKKTVKKATSYIKKKVKKSSVPTYYNYSMNYSKKPQPVNKSTKPKYTPPRRPTVPQPTNTKRPVRGNIRADIGIPETLTPGKAGYWNGDFCNDGGASEIEQYLGKIPDNALRAMIDVNFKAMNDEEVRNRNKSMELAYQYMNLPQYTVDEDVDGVFIHDKADYTGTFYAGDYTETPYMQRKHASPAYIAQKIAEGKLIGKDNVIYGADCSSLVTWAWQLEKRARTKSLRKFIDGEWSEKDNGITVEITAKESYESIAPGDAILKDGHVRLVAGNKDGVITFIEQSTEVVLENGNMTGMTNTGTVTYEDMAEDGYTGITMNGFTDEYINTDKDIDGILELDDK